MINAIFNSLPCFCFIIKIRVNYTMSDHLFSLARKLKKKILQQKSREYINQKSNNEQIKVSKSSSIISSINFSFRAIFRSVTCTRSMAVFGFFHKKRIEIDGSFDRKCLRNVICLDRGQRLKRSSFNWLLRWPQPPCFRVDTLQEGRGLWFIKQIVMYQLSSVIGLYTASLI